MGSVIWLIKFSFNCQLRCLFLLNAVNCKCAKELDDMNDPLAHICVCDHATSNDNKHSVLMSVNNVITNVIDVGEWRLRNIEAVLRALFRHGLRRNESKMKEVRDALYFFLFIHLWIRMFHSSNEYSNISDTYFESRTV